jgi:DNA-binding winged helix-turn-helix (wHTH) protein/tetratricopeptide (TPR) repeat protein
MSVKKAQPIIFSPFHLDAANQRLRRDDQTITLRPKAFAVLAYLLERPGQLVTKDELLDACWPETAVTDTVLKVCIREIREALGDDTQSPKFIETAHRRGYRFIGRITETADESDTRAAAEALDAAMSKRSPVSETTAAKLVGQELVGQEFVGRDKDMAHLRRWLEKAVSGDRQVVFINGEAGAGKTALVEAFLKSVAAPSNIWIARGQCLEQYGAGEAYLPVLEAFSRLCREPGRESLIELLADHAPTWLAQTPSLMSQTDRESMRRETLGATRERMLREMAEALEALTAKTPLALVIEDLHWSDYSTIDLISALARRREPARLLLIGTYRPVDLILSEHPLKLVKQELLMHRVCDEMPLEYLSEDAVADYLSERFPHHEFPAGLARQIHQRTEGNPLFMVNVLDYLLAEGLIVEAGGQWKLSARLEELEVGAPENIRQMIVKQIERLSREDQQTLEAASISSMEFSALAIASALGKDVIEIEERCEELARRNCFLRAKGVSEFPDGTVSARYGFIHWLYVNTFYERIPAARRARLHHDMAERGEIIYGERVGEIAGELAMHFERGRDYRRAVKYLRQAADTDSRRYANREAIDNLDRALNFIVRLPEAEQVEARMAALEQRGMTRRAMGDMKKAAEDLTALADLARERSMVETEVKALLYTASALSWVDRQGSLEALERAVALIPQLKDELLRAHARAYWGHWRSRFLNWSDEDEQACVEVINMARKAGARALLSMHVARHCYYLCLRSEYKLARSRAEEGAQLAVEVGDAFDYLYCQYYYAWALLHRGQWGEMLKALRAGTELADKNGQHLLSTLLNLETAWVYEQAFDFERAQELCERIFAETQKAQYETCQFLGLILLGAARKGLGQYERAAECFIEIAHRLEHKQGSMEWIFRLPLHHEMSRLWLAQGKLSDARRDADKLCELAALPGERAYLALGRQTLAEIALAEHDQSRAGDEITHALDALEGDEAPLAEWRVYAAAANFYEQAGRNEEAAENWTRSALALSRLADSLDGESDLKASLLASETAQEIARRAGRATIRASEREE